MKFFVKPSILIIWGLSFICSCSSSEDPLPAATTEGLNTFGCKINGKAWVATGASNENGPSTKPIEVEFSPSGNGKFYLFIHTNAPSRDRVQLTIPEAVVGTHVLTNRYNDPFGIFYDNQYRIFHSMEANPGKVTITRLDTVNRIVSGTFEFNAQYIVSKEIVRITDGRFDIDLKTL